MEYFGRIGLYYFFLLYSVDQRRFRQIDRGGCRVVSLGNRDDNEISHHIDYELSEFVLSPLASRSVFKYPVSRENGRKGADRTSR